MWRAARSAETAPPRRRHRARQNPSLSGCFDTMNSRMRSSVCARWLIGVLTRPGAIAFTRIRVRRVVGGHGEGHGDDARLCWRHRRAWRNAWARARRDDGGHIQDGAAFSRQHPPQHGARHQEHGFRLTSRVTVPAFIGEQVQRAVAETPPADAGDVEQRVDRRQVQRSTRHSGLGVGGAPRDRRRDSRRRIRPRELRDSWPRPGRRRNT